MLSTPPAFVLSQDQTLNINLKSFRILLLIPKSRTCALPYYSRNWNCLACFLLRYFSLSRFFLPSLIGFFRRIASAYLIYQTLLALSTLFPMIFFALILSINRTLSSGLELLSSIYIKPSVYDLHICTKICIFIHHIHILANNIHQKIFFFPKKHAFITMFQKEQTKTYLYII